MWISSATHHLVVNVSRSLMAWFCSLMVGVEVGREGSWHHTVWLKSEAKWMWCDQFASLTPHPSPYRRCGLMQVWFQNRRSKERRMKQLSALGARRHAFFRGPRRMRPLGGRLEDPDVLGPGAYGYYGGKRKVFSCYFSAKCFLVFFGPECISPPKEFS